MSKFIPTDEQWEKMQKHIKTDKYKKEDFFVFETLAVGDKVVPNRYMRLTPQLLEIMKQDAQKGVSLMLNHNWSQLGVQSIPIGKVFDARIDGPSQSGETTTLYTTQYILRDDSKVDGYSKNDIIKLIETGILADTSVGWGTTRDSYKCSICGNSIYDWRKCEHIPGKKYIVNEETNEVKECIIEACPPNELHEGNNVLMENSIVFDGAYPNAIIQSSVDGEVEMQNGKFKALIGKEKLSEKDVIFGYSANGNINLLYKKSQEKGGNEDMNGNEELEGENLNNEPENVPENTPETTPENTQANEPETPNVDGQELNNETTTVEQETEGNEETLYDEAEVLGMFGNIADSIEELVSLAKEGLENRKSVIANALESGVHSMGNAFSKEIFEKTFSNMSTKDIEEMGKAWEEQASAKFEKEKVSKQDFSNEEEVKMRVELKQFKTSNY